MVEVELTTLNFLSHYEKIYPFPEHTIGKMTFVKQVCSLVKFGYDIKGILYQIDYLYAKLLAFVYNEMSELEQMILRRIVL